MVERISWIRTHWRPAMAFVFMAVIIFDFIIGPILWSVLQAYVIGSSEIVPWVPLTLNSGGFFYISMSAILGASAWTRGKEKIEQIRQDMFNKK